MKTCKIEILKCGKRRRAFVNDQDISAKLASISIRSSPNGITTVALELDPDTLIEREVTSEEFESPHNTQR